MNEASGRLIPLTACVNGRPRIHGDLAGKTFGTWTALEPNDEKKWRRWKCRCVCGKEKLVVQQQLLNGDSANCGCQRKYHRVHGQVNSKTYGVWKNMVGRCTNPKHPQYDDYGGRGIFVCEKWRKFAGFYDDMGDAPAGLSIERINNHDAYHPGNVKWGTKEEQVRNHRRNRRIVINGRSEVVTDWAKENGIDPRTVFYRLNSGWDEVKAVTTPVWKH
jgi:hypothetical protein